LAGVVPTHAALVAPGGTLPQENACNPCVVENTANTFEASAAAVGVAVGGGACAADAASACRNAA